MATSTRLLSLVLLVAVGLFSVSHFSPQWTENNDKTWNSNVVVDDSKKSIITKLSKGIDDVRKELRVARTQIHNLDQAALEQLSVSGTKFASVQQSMTLTRMNTRGVPFVDHWRPLNYSFTANDIAVVWNALGSDDLDPEECTIPGKSPIAARFSYHGLGMNLIQLSNLILYASRNRSPKNETYVITMVALFEYDMIHNETMKHPFQNWIEQHFSFKANDTTCYIYGTKCRRSGSHCYEGFWDNPKGMDKNWSLR